MDAIREPNPNHPIFSYLAASKPIAYGKKRILQTPFTPLSATRTSLFCYLDFKNAIPPHALIRYIDKLALLKTQIEAMSGTTPGATSASGAADCIRQKNHGISPHNHESRLQTTTPGSDTQSQELKKLINEYHTLRKKYILAYDELLAVTKSGTVDLTKPEITVVIVDAIRFWEGKRLETQAFCIMSNLVHWVFKVNEKDEKGKQVYLQDIMHSVKRQTAKLINKITGRSGALWQKESVDTTIRDLKHEYNAIRYTLNNPVVADFCERLERIAGKLLQSWAAVCNR